MTTNKFLFQKHFELSQTYLCSRSHLMFTTASWAGKSERWGLTEVEGHGFSVYTRLWWAADIHRIHMCLNSKAWLVPHG